MSRPFVCLILLGSALSLPTSHFRNFQRLDSLQRVVELGATDRDAGRSNESAAQAVGIQHRFYRALVLADGPSQYGVQEHELAKRFVHERDILRHEARNDGIEQLRRDVAFHALVAVAAHPQREQRVADTRAMDLEAVAEAAYELD